MGPTVFLPGTIKVSEQKEWDDVPNRDNFLKKRTPYFALLKAGDLVMYDPRVLHCGAANDQEKGAVRAQFTLGFRNPKFIDLMGYSGSLRPAYSQSISLRDMTDRLSATEIKKGSRVDTFKDFGDGLKSKTA
jgi:ectoine hydroxylase-related dioxygenase (phytanoyl-CoA dioxygenase family)